jgi:hypothetical protein
MGARGGIKINYIAVLSALFGAVHGVWRRRQAASLLRSLFFKRHSLFGRKRRQHRAVARQQHARRKARCLHGHSIDSGKPPTAQSLPSTSLAGRLPRAQLCASALHRPKAVGRGAHGLNGRRGERHSRCSGQNESQASGSAASRALQRACRLAKNSRGLADNEFPGSRSAR